MLAEVTNLRHGERFVVREKLSGTFGAYELTIANMSVTGVQIVHAQPMRIGTNSRVTFKHGEIAITTQARVIWSHLSHVGSDGKPMYKSGLRIEKADPQYAAAINALLRQGVLERDFDSMERKRQRLAEREEQRKSQRKLTPTSVPIPDSQS